MISVPLQIDEPDVTPDVLDDLYMLSASAPTGGMYPVGSSGLWHGGVHLSLREGIPVKAPVGGRIVAARLSPHEEVEKGSDKKSALCAYGHTNFILTKHTWPPSASDEEGTPYYMLFMHLAQQPLDAVTAMPSKVPTWCTERPVFRLTQGWNLRTGTGTNHAAVFAEPMSEGTLLYPIEDEYREGDNGEYKWRKVRAFERDETGFVADFEGVTEPVEGTGIGGDAVDTLKQGQVANLDVPVEAGELLWWGGLFGQDLGEWEDELLELAAEALGYPEPIDRAPTLHWEVFSSEKAFGLEEEGADEGGGNSQGESGGPASENGTPGGSSEEDPSGEESARMLSVPSWTAVEGATSPAFTLNLEESDAADLIKEKRKEAPELPDEEDYAALSMGEKRSLEFTEAGKTLRTQAVKYASEWGLGETDIEEALKKSPAHSVEADKADLAAFQFWDKVDALPDDPTVWHYHPVTALQAIGAKHPWFYVEEDDKTQAVETMDDVHQAAGTEVYVSEVPDTWLLGHEDDEQGIYNRAPSSANLYELLIDPADQEGIPRGELSEYERNVWASLSAIEGNLRAINTYDNAHLSVGPLQQTAGAINFRGELFGAAHSVLQENEEAFRQHLGDKLDIPTSRMQSGRRMAYAEIGGTTLDSSAQKQRFRDELKWPYRFAKAFMDPDFREPMLREGFQRLPNIQDEPLSVTVTVGGEEQTIDTRIGDIFRSDLGQALLLDAHVNRPALVWPESGVNMWVSQAENLLQAWSQRLSNWTFEGTDDINKEKEKGLILLLLEQRMIPQRRGPNDVNPVLMTDPDVRAVEIFKYTENEVVQDLANLYANADLSQPDEEVVDRLKPIFDNVEQNGSSGQGGNLGNDQEETSVDQFLKDIIDVDTREVDDCSAEDAETLSTWCAIQNHTRKTLDFSWA